MLDSWPADAASEPDPEGYAPALAAVLCNHPREVAEDCANVRIGVVLDCMSRKALTAGRVHDWCVRHSVELREFVRREDERIRIAEEAAKARQAEIDRGSRQTLDELRTRHGKDWGLKRMDAVDIVRGIDPAAVEETRKAHRAEQDRKARAFNERVFAEDYARLGFEPVYDSHGVMLSPSLVRAINPARLVPAGSRTERRDGAEEAAA